MSKIIEVDLSDCDEGDFNRLLDKHLDKTYGGVESE